MPLDDVESAWAEMCLRIWGAEVRRHWTVRDQGWPPKSHLARMIEIGFTGNARGRVEQFCPEWLSKRALIVARSMQALRAPQRTILGVHYVVPLPAKDKWPRLRMKRATYYERLSVAKSQITSNMLRFSD